MVDFFQIPPNNSPGQSINVNDIQNVQMDGYTDADNTADLITQNQQNAQVIPGGPDPYSQSVIDAYNAQFAPQAIGPQGSAALYPGLSLPEAMGNYSGSIIGSNTLFAPAGGVMAIDPVLARRKAIEDAARARASSLVPFQPEEPFQLTDPRFQKKYEEQVLGFQRQFADDMRQKYGKDWTVVASNPNTKEGREFIQAMANYETIGREFNEITDRIAAIREGLASGELEFSDETLKIYDDYEQLVGNFEGGDIWKSKDLQGQLDKLDGFLSLEYYINDNGFLDNIMGEKGAWSQITDQGEYFQTSTGTVVKFDEAIDQVTESLARGPMRNAIRRGYMTPEKIKETLQSKFKTQRTAGKSMSQKSEATRSAETEVIIPDSDDVVRFEDKDGMRGQIQMFQYDDEGNRVEGGNWTIGSLMDIPITISGGKKQVLERTSDGSIQKYDTRGITMDNISVLTPDGEKSIPGNSILELENSVITKLADGSIALKAKVLVPTTTKEKDKDGEETGEFDSYTPQDHLIPIESSTGKGRGGITTKLMNKSKMTEEQKEAFQERLQQARDWDGKPSNTSQSGTSR